VADDVTPTPEDLKRDLRADLAWALKQIRWDDQSWYGWAIAAQRRALAAEAEREGLRKANALLLAGMESQAELMHDLKQKVRVLKDVADAADRVVDEAEALQETLPPHESYEVDGSLIRALAAILQRLEEHESCPPTPTP
jgi:hypothetical protein